MCEYGKEKNMKRKLFSMTMAVIMGLSLAACGSGGDQKPADEGNTAVEDKTDAPSDEGSSDESTPAESDERA